MTWIKICGTTNLEDALTAVDAGADALGFVFYEKSPRKIDVETAREIVAKLPARVEKVGVFVGESADEWPRDVLNVGLTSVQQYFGFKARVQPKNAKAAGIDGFPVPPKIYVALPVARFLEEEEKFTRLGGRCGKQIGKRASDGDGSKNESEGQNPHPGRRAGKGGAPWSEKSRERARPVWGLWRTLCAGDSDVGPRGIGIRI